MSQTQSNTKHAYNHGLVLWCGHWLVLVLVLMVILVYLRAYDCVRPHKPKWLKSNLLMQSAFYESSFCLTGKLRIKYNPHPINSKYDVLLSFLWKWAHVHWSRILWFAITIFLLYFFFSLNNLAPQMHSPLLFDCANRNQNGRKKNCTQQKKLNIPIHVIKWLHIVN